jgi:NitT/TauT family transport system ATP-binding protein
MTGPSVAGLRQQEAPRVEPAPDAAISLAEIGFRYSTDTPFIIRGLDLDIGQHEFFTLLGPSGCGKTTVLNLVAGYETPSEGKLAIGGRPIRGPGRDRIVIFQATDSLYPWLTAVENVEFPLRVDGVSKSERRERARDALVFVGLRDHGTKYPGQLSGGMKQRVQLARALVLDAPILLMDEPFGALDAQTRSVLQEDLVDIARRTERTILFITHDIAEAIFLADRIGVMSAAPQSRLKTVLPVTLPRPRSRGNPAFGELYDHLNWLLSEEMQRVLQREGSVR